MEYKKLFIAKIILNMGKDQERLHFIVKSWVMGQIGAVIFLAAVFFLGVINFIQSVIIGTLAYISSLAILKFFDEKINSVVRIILNFLNRHKKSKGFILKHF